MKLLQYQNIFSFFKSKLKMYVRVYVSMYIYVQICLLERRLVAKWLLIILDSNIFNFI